MGNGGLLPSCWLCQYAVRPKVQPTKSFEPIYCRRHDFKVFMPTHAFCTNLWIAGTHWHAKFIKERQFYPQMMYQWIDLYYLGYQEPEAVATLEAFASWTQEQQLESIQSLHMQKAEELKGDDNTELQEAH